VAEEGRQHEAAAACHRQRDMQQRAGKHRSPAERRGDADAGIFRKGELAALEIVVAATEAEALLVIDAIITGYTDAMAHHHAETKYYPVRGIAAAGDDPMRDRHPTDAFAELEDKQLWENRP